VRSTSGARGDLPLFSPLYKSKIAVTVSFEIDFALLIMYNFKAPQYLKEK
jgi:hypothetical protein